MPVPRGDGGERPYRLPLPFSVGDSLFQAAACLPITHTTPESKLVWPRCSYGVSNPEETEEKQPLNYLSIFCGLASRLSETLVNQYGVT